MTAPFNVMTLLRTLPSRGYRNPPPPAWPVNVTPLPR